MTKFKEARIERERERVNNSFASPKLSAKAGRKFFNSYFIKTATIFFCVGFLFIPQLSQAATKNWDFSSSSDYTFDNTKIEFSSGQAQLKATSTPVAWYSTSWTKRAPITINNTSNSSTLSNYQIQVMVTYDSDMQANFNDIRFTDTDGVTALDFWLASSTASVSAVFWVEVPSISASSNKTIYMYYGNSGVSSGSNGSNTFDFFDDFETSSPYAKIFDLFQGKPWTKYASNPILTKSASGWDSLGLRDPKLMLDGNGMLAKDNNQYIMYYSGYQTASPHYNRAIGRATSADGITWSRDSSNPVLAHGAPGSWDYFGTQLGNVIKRGTGDYIMYYSGVGDWNKWGVGIATSTDGITWTKYGSNPVLMNTNFNLAGNNILTIPNVTKLSNGSYIMYLGGTYSTDGYEIYAASSTDGLSWTVLNSGNAVLTPTAGQWDDDNIEEPILYEITAGNYLMLYHGNDNTVNGQHRMGMAYSTDLLTWTKYSENPVMLPTPSVWDGWRVENMFILKDDIGSSTIRMWYSGNSTLNGEDDSAIGYATNDQTASNYFSKWIATVTATTVVDNGNRVASLTGDDRHNSSLINRTGTFSNFIFEAKVKPTVDSNASCIPYFNFRYTGINNRYLMMLRGETTNDLFLRRIQGGSNFISTGYAFNYGVQYYDFKAIFNGTKIDAYLDNSHVVDYTDTGSGISSGKIGINNFFSTTAVYFDNVRVRKYTSPEPATTVGSEQNIYDFGNPTTQPTVIQNFTSLSSFIETATKNGGEIKYQISNNRGSTWYWYNSGWTTTSAGYTETNTVNDINSNISTFPKGSGQFLFKAYLHSDGSQLVQLDSIDLTYANDTTASPLGGYYATTQSVSLISLICNDNVGGSGCDKIYYTTNGDVPTTGSTQYTTTPISITGTTVLKFFSTDLAGNSETYQTQTYTFDTTGPTGTISNGNGTPTNSTTPTFNLTIADTGIGITGAQMRFSCNNSTWSTWENYATPKTNFNVRTGAGCTDADGSKTVYVEYKDSLGNIGSSYNTGAFTLNTSPPTVTPPSHHSSGGTAQNRVNNLISMGNYALAKDVANQYGLVLPPNTLTTIVTSAIPATLPATTQINSFFSRDLEYGMTNSDIKLLQIYLNTHGFVVATTGAGSLNHETNYFGSFTRAALVKFQKANNITPAVGYFGPITRGYITSH